MAAKRVAALITEYRKNSHADVIVGKILEGFDQKGGPGPNMKLVSAYVDQFPEGDMSRALAAKYGFKITPTIEAALTEDGKKLAVEGVLSIGEHGKYPDNERGQILYPRRRFFEETINTFKKCGLVVPFFNDKHLAQTWADAKWMYDQARSLFIPFMAGSSLPVTWRQPPLAAPKDATWSEVIALGYGPTEGYGFHAMEVLQCMIERRKGGETGVNRVQYLTGEPAWQALDSGRWSKDLLEYGISLLPAKADGNYRELCARDKSFGVYLIEYRDGLKASVAMLNGYVHEGKSGAFAFVAQPKGGGPKIGTHFYLRSVEPFHHFGYQLHAIDRMLQTNHPAYPVERTLLTTGILDAGMISRHENGRMVETPYLDVKYEGVAWPFPTGPLPD